MDEAPSPALVRAARDVGKSHRVLAIEDAEQVRVVSFDELAEPREHLLVRLGEEEKAELDWTNDSSRLAVEVKSKIGLDTRVLFAFSPEWSIQATMGAHWTAFSTWLTPNRYLVVNPGEWELLDVGRGGSSLGPLPDGEPRWNELLQLPFDLWGGWPFRDVVVESLDEYVWFAPEAERQYLSFSSPVSSFSLSSRDDGLVVVVDHDSPPEQPDDPNVWVVGARPEQRCLDDLEEGEEREDCLPDTYFGRYSFGEETILLSSVRVQDGTRERSLRVARWGADVVLGAEEGSDESRTLYQWETRVVDLWGALVGKWLYYLPSVLREPEEGFLDTAPIVRIDTSLTLEHMKAEVVARVAMPGRPDAGVRSIVRDGYWFSTVREAEGVAPGRWQKLDLQSEQVGDWQDTGFRGEYTRNLGERGLIFYDLGGSPFNATCNPCRYLAVEDILDPQSRWMEGFFEQAPPHHDGRSLVRGAPDGLGVLLKNGDVLEYRHFDRPEVHFPLTHLDEDSDVILPYSWNLDWYDEH